MKPSIKKIYSIIKLEGERGFTNDAVIGGLDRILDYWEGEARIDDLPEDFIQAVVSRMRDYPRLSQSSRSELLEGLWKRLGKVEASLLDEPFPFPRPKAKAPTAPPGALRQKAFPSAIPESITAAGKPKVNQDKGQVASERRPADGAAAPAALNTSIQVLPGIGPAHAKTLARLNIHTLRDALYFFPRRYDDYSLLKPINRLVYGEAVTVIGMLVSIKVRPIRSGKDQLVEAVVYDGTGSLRVNWFNQVHIAKRFQPKSEVVISGKVEQYLGRPVINNPEIELVEQEHLSTNRIVPVYPLTAHITQRWLREKIHQVVRYWAPRMPDPLPEELLSSAELIDLPSAISQVHYPDSWEALAAARHRLAFDEIFLLQLGVLRQKRDWQQREARIFAADPDWWQAQLGRLPYALTGAQQNALQDIIADLSSGRPMNRLLQGDVGSGKTIVAALAMAIVIKQDAQAALMAPTSILAEQHYQTLTKLLVHPDADAVGNGLLLKPGQLRLMIGATPEAEKKEILAGLEAGTIKLVVGTHTLIEEPVTFADLQMIVVDEQHRFGVEQRAALRRKGENAHLLVMTATPIPRTLALTIYGDLDLSVMDELPPGRQPVATFVLPPRDRERAYSLIRSQVQEGRQAFIIYPLVEESEQSEAKAAVDEYDRLQQEIFPQFSLGLLHGRMRLDEKDTVMERFRSGVHHILVATSVVEVGVDVPNANVMLIEGANRFGLATLHQFRGRVGRGAEKSYCILIPDTPDAAENERLQAMVETNDGFVLAERDLELRGPGQYLGTRQAGYSELQMANLTDIHIIDKARRHAQALFEKDPDLSRPEHQLIKTALQRFWSSGQGDIS